MFLRVPWTPQLGLQLLEEDAASSGYANRCDEGNTACGYGLFVTKHNTDNQLGFSWCLQVIAPVPPASGSSIKFLCIGQLLV